MKFDLLVKFLLYLFITHSTYCFDTIHCRCIKPAMVFPKHPKVAGVAGHAGQILKIL